MKLLFYALVSSVLLYVSCQKELEINYPDIEPKLVVNCLFTPDSTFSVRVGQMLSLNDTVTSFIINDAQCKIWENGIFAEDLLYTNNGFYVSRNIKAKTGNMYQIEISHPNFETVTATDTIPEPVEVSELYFEHNTLYDPLDENYFHDVNIRFQDNVAKQNYYELKLLVKEGPEEDDWRQTSNVLLTKTNDLTLLNTGLIDYQPASIPFSDKLFNGQNYFLSTYYKLSFGGSYNGEIRYNTHDLIVSFNAVSYQYYQYSRKMIMHLRNQESDILEGIGDPVQIYSNIENGYGIFAAYNPNINTLHHVHSWKKDN